ncbi:ABC-type transport auxiliary lipoprotein family protein [Methylogaea oryzae]|uniref:ABC-type transport auxiliary lipoprotein component domain-containing protein n=1 Tax=Methylogaea oryzae TaxID=1295382 RepID=A0A8D4VQ44_9GAMM|nr:ABC-type transport auxiliary lipoprotein family protein [Methylogaea oryzae]BBL71990.1 hypothetical protein MoryE10_25960 [Methylogaea oryzae]
MSTGKGKTSARTLLAATVFPIVLAACSLYPARPPAPSLHDFGPAPASAGAAANAVAVDAPPWLRSDRLRYRLLHDDPTLVRAYALDAWLAPPPALLAQRLRAAAADTPYRLRLTLTDFEQVFDSPAAARVVLHLQASAETADGKPVDERPFRYALPCPSPDAKGAVTAYAAAVERAVQELGQWLKTLP